MKAAMKELTITKGIKWIGGIDHDLRVFDITMYTEFGTSYNSYIVEGSEKTAIVETVKHTFTEEYIDFLNKTQELSKIDYILVNHTEPDHVGTVAKLLEYTPNAQIIGSAAAIRFLKEIANCPFDSIIVKEGDEISLGDKTLRFIMAPFLHWPDSIYTYVPEDKVLFTCDSFGAHYALDDVLASKIPHQEDYKKALKYYFDMIFGPFKSHMLSAIKKIEDLDIEFICNGHGPILDDQPKKIVQICKEWATEKKPEKPSIVIPYVSAYTYTKQLALQIAEGIQSQNIYDVKVYDMVYANQEEVMDAITMAEGVLFGSPTINGDALLPIMDILIKLSPITHGGKLAAAFGSYGWSGEGVEILSRRMKDLKFKVLKGMRVNFKPTDSDLKDAFDYGVRFVKVLTKEEVFVSFDAPKNLTHDVNDSKTIAKASNKEESDKEESSSLEEREVVIKKWICTVCQEVFEGVEAPDICAACGASKEQFEEYIEITQEISVKSEEHVVIIGNGVAGVTAAETIRKFSDKTRITIIDKANYPVYYKPMLSKFIGQSDLPKSFFIHDHLWYEKHQIEFIGGKTLVKIHKESKEILLNDETNDETKIAYDKLIIATGSESFVPPINNKHLDGVFTLRTYDDALAIKERMKTSKKAVVIGGGLLGLEAAVQMYEGGMDVTVIEIMDRLLPRQLDTKGAQMLEEGFKKERLSIVKGITVETIVGTDKVTGVKLVDGRVFEADLILISAGVRSDLSVFEAIGVACNRGITVNEFMETSVEDIYACGDCACYSNMNYSIWPEALLQGQSAGKSVIGIKKPYEIFVPSTIFNALELQIFSIGQVNVDESNQQISNIEYENIEKKIYKRLIFENEVLIGGIIIGDNKKTKLLIDGIKNQKKMAELMDVFYS